MIDYLSNSTGWQGAEAITQGQAGPVPGPLDKEDCLAQGPYSQEQSGRGTYSEAIRNPPYFSRGEGST